MSHDVILFAATFLASAVEAVEALTIVLAVGVARAGVLPGWLAALMPLGMAGVAGSLQYPPLLVISALALLASFGFVGLRLLRAPSAALAEKRPV